MALMSTSLQARQVDAQTAQQVAQQALQQASYARHLSSKPTGTSLKLVYTATAQSAKLSAPLSTAAVGNLFYVFNQEDGAGFVIVSADDAVSPILAYSNESSFRADSIPCNVQAVLDTYCEAIAAAIAGGSDASQTWSTVSTDASEATHLVQSQWNQSYPYNLQTPLLGGEHCVTGCVATAMAQIMYYWKYPEHGTGSYEYYWIRGEKTLSANFEEAFDWTNMRNTYPSGETFTQESVDAVSHLMSQCGVSVDMAYYTSSSASITTMMSALYTYFGYSPVSMCSYDLSSVGNTEWMNIIKSEIDNKRPIVYSSNHHAFICDGYDANDYLHINFGWGGHNDGFYQFMGTSAYLNKTSQTIVCGIMPNYMDPARDEDMVVTYEFNCSRTDSTLSSGDIQVNFYIELKYPSYRNVEDVALVTVDGDKNIVEHVGKLYYTNAHNHMKIKHYRLVNLCNEGTEAKILTFMPAYKIDGTWKVATDATPIVKTVTPLTSYNAKSVYISIPSNRSVDNSTSYMQVDLYTGDDNFKGKVDISVSNEAGATVHSESCDITIKKAALLYIPINYFFTEGGRYTILINVTNEEGDVVKTATSSLMVNDVVRLQAFGVDEDYYGEVATQRTLCFAPGDTIHLKARFRNPTGEDLTKTYSLFNWVTEEEKALSSVTIPAGGEATLRFCCIAEEETGYYGLRIREYADSTYTSVKVNQTVSPTPSTYEYYYVQTPYLTLSERPALLLEADTLTLYANQDDWMTVYLKNAQSEMACPEGLRFVAQFYEGNTKVAENSRCIFSVEDGKFNYPIDGLKLSPGIYTMKLLVSQNGKLYNVKNPYGVAAVYPVRVKATNLLPEVSRILNGTNDFRFSQNTVNFCFGETTQLKYALTNSHSETFRGTIMVKKYGDGTPDIVSEEKYITIAGNNQESVYGTIGVTVPANYNKRELSCDLFAKSQYDEDYRFISGATYTAPIGSVSGVDHVLADGGVTVADGQVTVGSHIKSVSVHDVSGRCVKGYDVSDTVVNLQALPKGTYVVVIDAEGSDPIRVKVVR